jgi:MSHA pilin protein MshD
MKANASSLRRGFTLIEAATASVVVGLLAGATLTAVTSATRAAALTGDRARARQLAGDLMAEVCAQAYMESGSTTLGPDAGEVNGASRAAFDDVDDYNGLSESPPKDRTGKDLAGWSGWMRTTTVQWVSPVDCSTVKAAESSAKLITVKVSKGNRVLAKVTAVRSAAWDRALWTGKSQASPSVVTAVVPSGG